MRDSTAYAIAAVLVASFDGPQWAWIAFAVAAVLYALAEGGRARAARPPSA